MKSFKLRWIVAGLTAALLVVTAGSAQAVTLDWDPAISGGTTLGGTGTWIDDLTTNNWWDASGPTQTFWIGGSDASFGGTLAGATTVLVDAAGIASVNSLTLGGSGGNYTLGGTGTITLTGAGGNVTVNTDATISTAVGGTVGLTKLGTATLTLSGANTGLTGGLTIKAGTVSGTTSANAFGDNTSVITIGDNGGSADATLNGGLAGTFANPITVAAGSSGNTLKITNSAASTFSGAVTLNNNLTLEPTLTNLLTLSGGITGTGNLTIRGTGTTAAVTLSTNPVNFSGTITNQGTNTGNTTISAAIGGSVTGVTQNSTSPLILSGANNAYTGTTTLTSGTLQGTTSSTSLNPVSPFGASSLALNGGILQLRASGTLSAAAETITFGNNTTVGGTTTIDVNRPGLTSTTKTIALGTLNIGAQTLNVTGGNSYYVGFGATTASGAAVFNPTSGRLTLASLTLDDSVSANTTTTITLGGTNTSCAITGIISDNASDPTKKLALEKSGSSTWSLSGTNTYSGGTTLNGGTLAGLIAGSLGTGTLTVTGNASLTPNYGSYPVLPNSVEVNPGVTLTINNATQYYGITFSGALTGSGNIAVGGNNGANSGPSAGFTSSTNTFTGTITVTGSGGGGSGASVTVNSLGDGGKYRFNGNKGGTYSYTFGLGAGTASPLVFNTRQIELGNTAANSLSIIENANANVNNTITIGTDLSITTAGAKTLQLQGGNTGNNAFNGVIADGTVGAGAVISITKAGTGTWVLSGANTYSGATTVSAGKLLVGVVGGSCANSDVTVSGGTLGVSITDNTKQWTCKSLTHTGSTTALEYAFGSITPGTTVAPLQVNGNAAFYAAPTVSCTGAGLTGLASGIYPLITWTGTMSGAVPSSVTLASGTGNLVKDDASKTLWLNVMASSEILTWTGPAGSEWKANESSYTYWQDATPATTYYQDHNKSGKVIGDSVAFNNNGPGGLVTLNSTVYPSAVSVSGTTDYTISGTGSIAGGGGLTKAGTCTLTLATANTFAGSTNVTGGTLQLTDPNALGSSSGLSLANGTKLALRSDSTVTFTTPTIPLPLGASTVTFDVNNNSSGTGNTLTLSGGFTLNNNNNSQRTINITGGNGYSLSIPTANLLFNGSGANGKVLFYPTTADVHLGAITLQCSGADGAVTLDGTSTGNSADSIIDNGVVSNLSFMTKQGTGTWTVGDITSTKGMNITAGKLIVNGTLWQNKNDRQITLSGATTELHYNNPAGVRNQPSATKPALAISAGNLDNSSGAAITTSTYNPTMQWGGDFTFIGSQGANSDLYLGTGAVTISGATRQVTVQNAATTLTVGGVISGATFGLTKAGDGTLKLTGASTYTGATTVSAGTLAISGSPTGNSAVTVNAGGTLKLDYSTLNTSKINDSAVLTLGGGTLNLSGGTHTEAVASTTLNAGVSSVTRSSGSAVLRMGFITPGAGGAVGFGAANIASTSTTNDASGILGAWATVGGTDWATNSLTDDGGGVGNSFITAYAGYTDVTRLDSGPKVIADGATTNVRIIEGTGSPANITLGGVPTTTINTLNQSASGGSSAATIDPAGQTLCTNAILVGTGAGALTIGTGTNNGWLTTATAWGDLLLINNTANALTINSAIADNNGFSTLTKSGTGTATLAGANIYSGGTTLAAGTLQLGHASALGIGTLTFSGGNLDSSVANLVNANNNAQAWNADFTFVGSQNLDLGIGSVALSANRQVTVTANTLTVGGDIGGAFNLTKAGAGTLVLAGANTFTGAINVNAGRLNLTNWGASTLGTVTVSGTSGAILGISGSATYSVATRMFVGQTAGNGTVNQTGGTVSFTASDALLLGNGTGSSGTYNLSGGTLTSYSSTTRGVMLGVNPGNSGTFNLSGTGNLSLEDSILMIGRSDSAAAGCVALFNQTGGTATVKTLTIGGTGAGNTNATMSLTAGTFAATTFTKLATATNDVVAINIGGTADVTLPAFPTTRGTGATATITFDGGTLKPAAASATYMGGLTNAFIKAGGATFDVASGKDITITQALLTDTLSFNGGLTKSGVGALTLSGANTYTGPTLVSGGRLQLDGSAAAGTLTTSGLTVGSAGTLGFTAGTASTLDLTGKPFSLGGTVAFDIGSSGVNDSLTVNDFTLTGNSAFTFNPIGAITNGATYTLLTSANAITTGGFSITGLTAGKLTLTPTINANTVTLTPVFLEGIWNQTGGGIWSSGGNWTNYTPTFAGDAALFGSAITAPATITVDSAQSVGYLRFDNATKAYTIGTTGSSYLTLDNGAFAALVVVNSGSHLIAENVALTSNTIVVPASGTTLTVSGNLSGAGNVQLIDAGTLVLSGTNSYTGTTSITAGTLEIGGAGQLGSGTYSGAIAISTGATFKYNSSAEQTLSGVISGGGSLIKDGTGTLTLINSTEPANTYTGLTTINNGVLKLQGDYAFWTTPRTYTIGSLGVLNLDGDSYIPVGTTTINGAGTLRITNGEFYSYEAGDSLTLSLGSGGRIDVQAGAVLWNGYATEESITWTANLASLNVDGVFDVWNGNDVFVDALTGAGTVQRTRNQGTPVTLTVGVNNGSGEFSGIITNGSASFPVAFTKTGSGTQTLSGANTYSGATTIQAGTLQLGNGSTTGSLSTSSAISVASGATFAVNQSDTVTQGTDFSSAAITGAGGFTQAGTGTTVLTAANTYSGATNVSAGTLKVTGSIKSILPVNVSAGATLLLDSSTTPALGVLGGVDITNDGTFEVTAAGAQGVGAVSGGTGSITKVDDNASLTANSILQDTLTIGAGATLTLRPTTAGGDIGGLGNVSQQVPVPEPGTWVLLAAGAACLLPLVRRQRRAA